MFKGKRFRIKTTTLGIAAVRNQRIPVAVPADATVEVISHTQLKDRRDFEICSDEARSTVLPDRIKMIDNLTITR